MLVTLKEILALARANRYAVPAFDCTEDIMVRTVLETSEANKAPVIVMALEIDLETDGGTPNQQIREAVQNGICKVNLYADLRVAMYRGLRATSSAHERIDPLPKDMFQPIRDELAEAVEQKIELLGAKNRASGQIPLAGRDLPAWMPAMQKTALRA